MLDKIAHTIRERMRIRGQVRVYTAQGKMTGTVLAALPLVLGMIILALNRSYFQILFEHEYGLFMIGGGDPARDHGLFLDSQDHPHQDLRRRP